MFKITMNTFQSVKAKRVKNMHVFIKTKPPFASFLKVRDPYDQIYAKFQKKFTQTCLYQIYIYSQFYNSM